MFLLSVKFNDGRSILCDKVTYINLSELPSVSYEVDNVPDLQGFELDNSVTFFSFSYIKTFDNVHFVQDSESGGQELSEFWNPLPDLEPF